MVRLRCATKQNFDSVLQQSHVNHLSSVTCSCSYSDELAEGKQEFGSEMGTERWGYRAPELEYVVQFPKIAAVGEEVGAYFDGEVGVLHEVVCLTEGELGTEGVVWIPLCLPS